jgi:hypothetical protein
VATKDNLWAINTEMEYQEEIQVSEPDRSSPARPSSRKIAVAATTIE